MLSGEVTGTEAVDEGDTVGDDSILVTNAVVGDSAKSPPFRLTMVNQVLYILSTNGCWLILICFKCIFIFGIYVNTLLKSTST